jgi:hypothetical protein
VSTETDNNVETEAPKRGRKPAKPTRQTRSYSTELRQAEERNSRAAWALQRALAATSPEVREEYIRGALDALGVNL